MSDAKDFADSAPDYDAAQGISDEPGDSLGNRYQEEQAPEIDDDIGNRLAPVEAEAHIDDDIGNRAQAPERALQRQGRGRGRGRGRRNNKRKADGEQRGRSRRDGRSDGRRGAGRSQRQRHERAPHSEYVLKSDPEDKRSKALETCTEIVRLCQREAQVTAELVDENGQPKVVVMVSENDSENALFMRNSAALSALNFLTNKVVNRFPDDRIRLVVHTSSGSAGGRRRERVSDEERQATEAMARELAAQAVRTGRILSVAPMRSELRRVIHLSLEKHDDVVTMSEGEGAFRKLLIVPRSMIPQAEPEESTASAQSDGAGDVDAASAIEADNNVRETAALED